MIETIQNLPDWACLIIALSVATVGSTCLFLFIAYRFSMHTKQMMKPKIKRNFMYDQRKDDER